MRWDIYKRTQTASMMPFDKVSKRKKSANGIFLVF